MKATKTPDGGVLIEDQGTRTLTLAQAKTALDNARAHFQDYVHRAEHAQIEIDLLQPIVEELEAEHAARRLAEAEAAKDKARARLEGLKKPPKE